ITGNLKERTFFLRPLEAKHTIVKKGRITPALKALQKYGKTAQQFQTSWYGSYKWLTSSARWPCLLLTTKKSTWLSEGYSDWKNLSWSALHCFSKEHIQNEVSLKHLEPKETPIDALLNEYIDNVRKKKKLVDISVLLSHQELAFHGHDETADLINQGNYRGLFDCFFHHNTLRAHWQRNSIVFSRLSKTIQNELTGCVAKEIRLHIDWEIKERSVFACEVDKTTDIFQLGQFSLVLHYVDKKGNPQERSMGFKDISVDRTTVALKQAMDSVISKYDYTTKLVSQSYDGAAVMAGERGGLQVLIKMEGLQTFFGHCFAHQLNLILQQGAQNMFFCIPEWLYYIFHLFKTLGRGIPSLCAVQWTSNSRDLYTILSEREPLCDVFQEIVDGPGSQRQASGYLMSLTHFQFLVLAFSYCRGAQLYFCEGQISKKTTLQERVADIKALRFLEFVDSSWFPAFSKQFPLEAFTSFSNSYGSYFDLDHLKNKTEFGVIFSDDQFQKCSVSDILHIIIETVVGTIPENRECGKKLFFCLKRIKTYLRSTMEQGHLSVLATISIEKELLSFLEKQPTWYDDVITRFASQMDRWLDLYK
uniref:DUF4371 domain-containing protein n=1 Tax=Latimeria chalumnae TaxID=7897 RepID=H3BB00_LATCH